MRRFVWLNILLVLTLPAMGQSGGQYVYGFLETNHNFTASAASSSAAALTITQDAFLMNPALADTNFVEDIACGYYNYIADINAGSVLTSMNKGRFVPFVAAEYFNYGTFEGYDQMGNSTGNFHASDLALVVGSSFRVDTNLTVGLSFKPVFSWLESYFSYGLALDAGVRYRVGTADFTLVVRNLGKQLKPYNNIYEPLPLNVAAAVAIKLRYAPFKPFVTFEHLEDFNLFYKSPIDSLYNLNLTDTVAPSAFELVGREMVRHISFGSQVVFSKHVSIVAAYNLRRAEELSLPTLLGSEGLSLSLLVSLSKFSFGLNWQKYHVAASSTFFYFQFSPQKLLNIKNNKP